MGAVMPLVTSVTLVLVYVAVPIPVCLTEFASGEIQRTSKEYLPSKGKLLD